MKKILIKLGTLFLLGMAVGIASAQTTAVTATIVDSTTQVWANGTYTIQFVPSPSQPNINIYNINGTPLNPALLNFAGVLNGSGFFTQTLYDNSRISPSGSQWKFNICPNSSAPCGSSNVSIAGATQDLSSYFTSTIPPVKFNATYGSYGYNDSEVILTNNPGQLYYNVIVSCLRIWSGTAWACGAGSGGIPIDCGTFPNNQACINLGDPALIRPGDVSSYIQANSATATVTCVVDNTTTAVSLTPLNFGTGYIPGKTYNVTVSGLAGGELLSGIVSTAANSAGQITGYTISGANSGFPTTGLNTYGCPSTLVLAVDPPPAAPTPTTVINYNEGLTTYTPTIRVDDFCGVPDGVTDDTQCINNAIAYAASTGLATISFTEGKTYLATTVTGNYRQGFDDGTVPIASEFTCPAPNGTSTQSCTLVVAGSLLTTNTVTNTASSGTGATITPSAVSGGTVPTMTIGPAGLGYPSSFTVYSGPLCGGSLCQTLPPINNQTGYIINLPKGITIQGNEATIKGPSFNMVGACIHTSSWAASGSIVTFQYTAPGCGSLLSAGLQLTLEGFGTTQSFNGVTITVNPGFTSSSFSASVPGATGSNTEVGYASTLITGYPYVALFANSSNTGFAGVTMNNLQLEGFIGLGNVGSGNSFNGVTCNPCGIFAQGSNVQETLFNSQSNFAVRSNLYSGIILGGTTVSRSPFFGVNHAQIVNDTNLADGTRIDSFQPFFGDVNSQQVNDAREGLDCWFDQNVRMLESGPIRNMEFCWQPPGGIQRLTDQDQAAFTVPDGYWRGIYQNAVDLYSLYGRPVLGFTINAVQSEEGANYPVIIGAVTANASVTNVSGEDIGVCNDGFAWGTPPCNNPFEPQYPNLSGLILGSQTGTAYDSITGSASAQVPLASPWQTIPGAASNSFPSRKLTFPGTNITSSSLNFLLPNFPVNPLGPTANSALTAGIFGTINQADGARLASGSQELQFPMTFGNVGSIPATSYWLVKDASDFYDITQHNTPELYFTSRAGTSPTVMMQGLRVSPTLPQGGNLLNLAITNAGSGYPYNYAVACAVQPSPLLVNGSTLSHYMADCQASSTVKGLITTPVSTRLGVGYISAPTVIVAPPGAAAATCTAPASGVPDATCKVVNPGFQITDGCALITAANFSVGSGATYTPTCVNGQMSALTVSGGTAYPNFWYVYVGTNGGTQATMTATVTGIDPPANIEHFEKCSFNLSAGGSVAAGTTATLPGITGNCGNAIFQTSNGRGDYITILNLPGVSGHAGLNVSATITAAGTITVTLANNTSAAIAYSAGIWTAELISANSDNDLPTPTAVTPTVTTAPNGTILFATPASSSTACTVPQVEYDSGFIYTCVATNSWRRVATTTF